MMGRVCFHTNDYRCLVVFVSRTRARFTGCEITEAAVRVKALGVIAM